MHDNNMTGLVKLFSIMIIRYITAAYTVGMFG